MRLLLTRPLAQSLRMARQLRACGFRVWYAPMLHVRPVQFDPSLLERARALVVTSANAVPALRALAPASRKVFAVGPDTALALQRAGIGNVATAAGTASDLIDLVMENWRPSEGAIAYASGQDVSLDVSEALGTVGYDCSRVAVYAAYPSRRLNASTTALLAEGRIDAAVFISVRTAETFEKLARASGVADACSSIVSVSLSGKIASALASLPFGRSLVAPSPTRRGIFAELRMLAGRPTPDERRSS